jgi:hypothetical protein
VLVANVAMMVVGGAGTLAGQRLLAKRGGVSAARTES